MFREQKSESNSMAMAVGEPQSRLTRLGEYLNWPVLSNYIFILPALAMFVTFNLYPYFKVFQLSVYEWNGISPTGGHFVALANYKDILVHNISWWVSMRNATYITLLALTIQNSLALLLAWI